MIAVRRHDQRERSVDSNIKSIENISMIDCICFQSLEYTYADHLQRHVDNKKVRTTCSKILNTYNFNPLYFEACVYLTFHTFLAVH